MPRKCALPGGLFRFWKVGVPEVVSGADIRAFSIHVPVGSWVFFSVQREADGVFPRVLDHMITAVTGAAFSPWRREREAVTYGVFGTGNGHGGGHEKFLYSVGGEAGVARDEVRGVPRDDGRRHRCSA